MEKEEENQEWLPKKSGRKKLKIVKEEMEVIYTMMGTQSTLDKTISIGSMIIINLGASTLSQGGSPKS